MVYMYRSLGRGQLSTRHGAWLGPARIIGTESSTDGMLPRLVWVSYNGFQYNCSPEGLRPIAEDEVQFRALSKALEQDDMPDDVERADEQLREKSGQFIDLTR